MLCLAPGPWCRQLSLSETFPTFSTCSPLQLEWSRIEYKIFTWSKGPAGASSCPALESHLNLLLLLPSSSHISPLHTPVVTKFFITSSFPHRLFYLPRSMFLFSIFHLLYFYTSFKSHFTYHRLRENLLKFIPILDQGLCSMLAKHPVLFLYSCYYIF